MSLRSASDALDALLPRATVPATQCYTPSGVAVGAELIPCNAVLAAQGDGSMCCNMGVNSQNDTCHPTGLCQNGANYYRDSCSDPTWSSPNCLKSVCTNSDDFGSSVGYSQVYACGGSDANGNPTFCCGNGRSGTCCSNSTAIFSMKATLVATNSSAATATVTVTATAGATSKGADGATIGLGVALGVVVLASLAGFFLLRRKWRAALNEHVGGLAPQAQDFHLPKNDYNTYHEVPANPPPAVEMPTGQQDHR